MIATRASGPGLRFRPARGLVLAALLAPIDPLSPASAPSCELAGGPRDEAEHVYEFAEQDEFGDFRAEEGAWRVYGGALVCRSKGATDSLRWRRSLAGASVIDLDVASAAECSLELSNDDHVWVLRLHRAKGTLGVMADGRELRRLFFEQPPERPLRLSVILGSRLAVRVGDDVPISFDSPGPLTRLRVQSHGGQARFTRLLVRRDQAAIVPGSEDRQLRLEDALARSAEGEARRGLELLRPLFPEGDAEARGTWPVDLLTALQRIGLADPRLLNQAPLDRFRREGVVHSRDGAVSLGRPLQPGWSVELHPCRRIDGILIQLRHGDGVEATLRRYDQRLEYWFGAEPRLRFVGGGDSRSLAEARLADLEIEFEGAIVRGKVKESDSPLGGETAYTFALDYDRAPGSTLDGPRRRQEWFARFRGNTYRWSIDGPPEAVDRHEEALHWTTRSLSWHRSTSPDDRR